MEREEKKKCLIETFSDAGYQKQLLVWRDELEIKLGQFISWLKKQLSEEQKIVESMEMRIKSVNSFCEKLERKDYISRCPDGNDRKEWQQIVGMMLSDLIGFRINCYFYKDEEVIYRKLKQYTEEIGWEDIELDFSAKTVQSNGHAIYKVEGVYKKKEGKQLVKKVRFELQIKSMIHNIWGEVDHRTIYKQRDYEINPQSREEVTEQVFGILKASDMQLYTLYRQNYTEQRIIEALFYKQTVDSVSVQTKTNVLGRHYEHFFNIFFTNGRVGLSEQIRTYCAERLVGKEHKNKQWKKTENSQGELVFQAFKLLKDRYVDYDIDVLRRIASHVAYFRSKDDFRYFLAQELVGLYLPEQEFDYEEDAFSEAEDEQKQAWEDFIKKMDIIFKKRG